MTDLDQIIQRAYTLFAGNKPQENLDACTHCCMKESDAVLLRSIPLHQVSVDLLYEYQEAAKPAKLNHEELKYFAPKYLDFIWKYQFPAIEPLLSMNRFGYFEPSDWEEEEWSLLNEFAYAFFKRYLETAQTPVYVGPIEILLMFYKAKIDIQPLLTEWTEHISRPRLLHFQEAVEEIDFSQSGEPSVRDAFSDEPFSEIFCTWMFSDTTRRVFRDQIESIILKDEPTFTNEQKELLSLSYEILK